MTICGFTKPDGEFCRITVEPPLTRCYWHAPEYAEKRRRIASKAGRGNREIREIKTRLKQLFEALDGGEMDPRRGATMVQVANAMLRALTVEAELKNAAEVERKLQRIEQLDREARRWAN